MNILELIVLIAFIVFQAPRHQSLPLPNDDDAFLVQEQIRSGKVPLISYPPVPQTPPLSQMKQYRSCFAKDDIYEEVHPIVKVCPESPSKNSESTQPISNKLPEVPAFGSIEKKQNPNQKRVGNLHQRCSPILPHPNAVQPCLAARDGKNKKFRNRGSRQRPDLDQSKIDPQMNSKRLYGIAMVRVIVLIY